MITSKERAELRSKANSIDTTLIIGKSGITDTLIADADAQLKANELIKCKVLETALLTAREASDGLCEALHAEGIRTVGNKFVIYRKSEKQNPQKKKAANPVKEGAKRRKEAAKSERERRNQFFRQKAIEASIEKSRMKKNRFGE